jgi:hypothetical protein
LLFFFVLIGACLPAASAEAQTTPLPILITSYKLTPPILTNEGGTALTTWRQREIDPYTDGLDPTVVLPRDGCQHFPTPKNPKIILSGTISGVAGVSYEVDYEVSGPNAAWKVLTPLTSSNMTADGSFSVNWFDFNPTESCPTRNTSFRVLGTDTSTGQQYVSPTRTVRVLEAVRGLTGPPEPPFFHPGTVWTDHFSIKDPGVTSIKVLIVGKSDPHRIWRLTARTQWRVYGIVPLKNGRGIFHYRIPNGKTHVFRFYFAGTADHAPTWTFETETLRP